MGGVDFTGIYMLWSFNGGMHNVCNLSMILNL